MKIINEIGNTYNNLQVIAAAKSKNGSKKWVCKCVKCGQEYIYSGTVLRNGKVKCDKCKYIGLQFGELTVLKNEYVANDRHLFVKCKCSCGREEVFRATDLINKKYEKCKECRKIPQYINEIGNVYGRLTVLEYAGNTEKGQAKWRCQCECGNITEVKGTSLRNGQTRSCGCINSIGEEKIISILKQNQIQFKTQIRFSDCKAAKQLRFDFGIYNENGQLQYIIEYDGIQHFFSVKNGWNTPEVLKEVQKRDKIKNDYCIKNNIPLIRIPYTRYNDLELKDLLLESSDYIWAKPQNMTSIAKKEKKEQ